MVGQEKGEQRARPYNLFAAVGSMIVRCAPSWNMVQWQALSTRIKSYNVPGRRSKQVRGKSLAMAALGSPGNRIGVGPGHEYLLLGIKPNAVFLQTISSAAYHSFSCKLELSVFGAHVRLFRNNFLSKSAGRVNDNPVSDFFDAADKYKESPETY